MVRQENPMSTPVPTRFFTSWRFNCLRLVGELIDAMHRNTFFPRHLRRRRPAHCRKRWSMARWNCAMTTATT